VIPLELEGMLVTIAVTAKQRREYEGCTGSGHADLKIDTVKMDAE
jgi:hypothetical protein